MTDPQAIRDVQFFHRAQRIAADLWDERRDLLKHEEDLLFVVRRIGTDYTQIVGDANRYFGIDSKAALAVEFAARQRRQERYQAALEKYESFCVCDG